MSYHCVCLLKYATLLWESIALHSPFTAFIYLNLPLSLLLRTLIGTDLWYDSYWQTFSMHYPINTCFIGRMVSHTLLRANECPVSLQINYHNLLELNSVRCWFLFTFSSNVNTFLINKRKFTCRVDCFLYIQAHFTWLHWCVNSWLSRTWFILC